MEDHRQASSANLTKKLSNGFSIYDGVFCGPAKRGSRVENYGEIFCGGSDAVSSIPILDVPEMNEGKVSVDVRSSSLDYSKIFGGSNSTVSYEELFAKPNKERNSSPEVRTPRKIGSYGAKSDSSKFSQEKDVSSREASFQSFHGVKRFNVSYQKTNQGIGKGTNGTTHIVHLGAVPGFACLVNEIPSHMSEGGKPTPATIDSAHSNIKFHEGKMEGSPCKNSMTGPGLCDTLKKTAKSGDCNRSNPSEILYDAFKIDFSHLPSRAPPPSEASPCLGKNKFRFQRSAASKIEDSGCDAPDGASSPPYFDVEVDANSVAAVSAAAVRKAIEEAQARIKIAKELMERKKEALQNRVKLNFDDLIAKKCGNKVKKLKENKAQDVCGRVYEPNQLFVGMQTRNIKANQVNPGFIGSEKATLASGAVGRIEREEFKLAEDHQGEATKKVKTTKQFCELVNADVSLLKHKLEYNGKENIQSQKEFELKKKKFMEPEMSEEFDKKLISVDAHELDRFEGKLNSELEGCANKLNSTQKVHDQEENEQKFVNVQVPQESEHKIKASNRDQIRKNSMKELQNPSEDGKKLREPDEGMNNMSRNPELIEKERKLKENEKLHKEPCEWIEDAETEVAVWKLEENKEWNDANWYNENKPDQVYQQKVTEVKHDVYNNGEESAKLMEEVYEIKDKSVPKETGENEENFEDANQVNENEERWDKTSELVQTERTDSEIDQRTAGEIENDTLIEQENDAEESDDLCEQDDNDKLSSTSESYQTGEDIKDIDETAEAHAYEDIGMMLKVTKAPIHPKKNKKESTATTDAYNKEENFKSSGQAQSTLETNEAAKHLKDAGEAPVFDENGEYLGETYTDFGQQQNEQYVEETETVYDPGEQTEASTSQSVESDDDMEESKPSINEENREKIFESSIGERQVDNGTTAETPQLPSTSEGNAIAEETAKAVKSTQITQSTEENCQKTLIMDEKEAENTSRKKVELEKKRHKILEEEKERERERERMAVERAIREARERAFVEARERAERAALERATAAARGRVVADAREKSERVSVDTNEKSSAEKAAMEAKLKAERSAVDRATAEARERALEKALSEKTFKPRNHGENVAAGKVSCSSSKENGMRWSYSFYGSQNKVSDSSTSPRFSSSAYHSVPNSTEKFDGTNGQSTQQCKVTLERNQRTAERAAKALAEKNMRDHLAQKERAERNRLAEALDAEVKRWSSGKEGNLRALIATLQYILGPDSGWQPIPLTDIRSTTAVKKAYRKATLFVHPDKLQQRGASMQQKYTCEKVFDLLKEAYNKISAEDR